MWICESCRRHVREDEGRCPFCERTGRDGDKLRRAGRAVALSLALAGCAADAASADKEARDAKPGAGAPARAGLASPDVDSVRDTGPVEADVPSEPYAVRARERRHAESRKRRRPVRPPYSIPVPLYGNVP